MPSDISNFFSASGKGAKFKLRTASCTDLLFPRQKGDVYI